MPGRSAPPSRGRTSRPGWRLALLLIAAVLAALISLQIWRSLTLEQQLRASEAERADLLGRRILRAAATSRDVMAALPAAHRFVLRGDQVLVDDSIAWLQERPVSDVVDPIVENRLARAARAEFVSQSTQAAVAEFDELLAGPLQLAHELQVLAAAAWHARRSAQTERCQALFDRLRAVLASVRPAQLAQPVIANAVASAQQLGESLAGDGVTRELLPFLPPLSFAGLSVADEVVAEHAAVCTRRDRARVAQAGCLRLGSSPAPGLHEAVGPWLLWILPESDGSRQAAIVTPQDWFRAVRQVGRDGALFEWPERVQPHFGAPTDGGVAGVPGLLQLRAANDAVLDGQAWLLPALTALLVGGFLLAVSQQVRASRREAAAVALQAQFLTTVTHELKTPLAGIRLLGEMLAEGRARGREAEYYRLLVGESGRLSMLIENVLDLGRLERGERDYVCKPEPIAEIVHETLAMFVPVAEQDGVTVTFDDRLQGGRASVDRAAFVQALVAVLDNARKYGRAGKRIEIEGRIENARMLVCVRDYGPGVPAAERERVFERFVRGAADAHGSTPGVGIGLYLARTIVRKLGGELRCVAPDDGVGAMFCFEWQLVESTA